ncbi:gamma-glutamyltransferase [Mycolicibacterium wolinskyi]|uniref:gamma-glutamyltransferase n=1 Tax=Mycolicibacterium wolinskyi TaxID=59750 RepID=UPI0039177FA2
MLDVLARRAVASGSLGAVSAGSRTAAAIGASALLAGGNAFDAALAAALSETVALPSKCGLAGDVVALYVTAGASAPISLVAIGGASAGLYAAAEAAGWEVPATGPLSVGIPGAPAGYSRIAELARLPLDRLVAPAVELARRGVWWSPMNATLECEARALLYRYQPDGCVYSPRDATHTVGDMVRLPGLAVVLEEFVARGADLFTGPVGDAVVDCMQRHGGMLTATDLVSVDVAEEAAHCVQTESGPLWATNAPTYGPALTHAMAGRVVSDVGPGDVRRSLAELADTKTAAAEGTSTVAAVDEAGNAVVLVHSLSFPQYGSGLVVGEYDLILSNRAGRGFTFAPGHPNAPVAGRRPLTTLHAWGIGHRDGWILGATPGGQQQVPWNVQLVAQLLDASDDGEQAMGDALVTPRWQLDAPGDVRHEGQELGRFEARSSHTLVRTATSRCAAAADPRWDGAAVAV